ncbi:hypothetical protein [Saccharothrix sp. HUAS TT1]|uniref:hypothetical protein n=1 Tax=unclassified Saccharothrix TaxID=2593673 RepID=UPI00345C5E22
MFPVAVLACPVMLVAVWPDGGRCDAWTVPAGEPVQVNPVCPAPGVVRVHDVRTEAAQADVPAGWVELVDVDVPF